MIRTLQIWLLIIYVLGIAGLMSFIVIKTGEELVPSTQLSISRETNIGFLSKTELLENVSANIGVDSVRVNQLQLDIIEKAIMEDPFVESVDAFTNIDGQLLININEKIPIVRIFNKRSPGFYLTEDGGILPLRNSYSARVLVVNGFVNIALHEGNANVNDTVYGQTPLKGILELTNEINKNEFLRSQINQIYLNSKNEFEMIPEFGNHTIVVGNLHNLDKKLQKLMGFYEQVLLEEGINKYRVINLKFDGQVVCTKK